MCGTGRANGPTVSVEAPIRYAEEADMAGSIIVGVIVTVVANLLRDLIIRLYRFTKRLYRTVKCRRKKRLLQRQ